MEFLKYVTFVHKKSITKAGNNMFQDLINVPHICVINIRLSQYIEDIQIFC